MKTLLSNTRLILAVIMIGITHSVLSQVIPLTDRDYHYEEAPFKGFQFSISVDNNVITDCSTNILRCRIKNDSTNAVIWTKWLYHRLAFEDTNNGQLYYLPTFGALDMASATSKAAINQSVFLRVGESYEWVEYFSKGHRYDRNIIPEFLTTNNAAQLNYMISNSASFAKEYGRFSVRTSGRVFTQKEEPPIKLWVFHSNDLEITVVN